MEEEKKCIKCGKIIPQHRFKAYPKRNIITCSKKCSVYRDKRKRRNKSSYKSLEARSPHDKLCKLRAEFERYKELSTKIHLDLWNRLKKHEPNLTWDEEPK